MSGRNVKPCPKARASALVAAGMSLLAAQPSFAQTPPDQAAPPPAPPQPSKTDAKPKKDAPKPQPAKDSAQVITVTAPKPKDKIDREIYDPKNDPDTPTATAADTLNKAPGVYVDPEGNVTLRGSSSVQVLVNGKSSAMMQGSFRAGTLQSMPADSIDTIEVMTTPSAQFSAEGGAGIINIVLKKNRTPGPTMFNTFAAGSLGRYRIASQGGYGFGALTLNGGFFYNHDVRDTTADTDREQISSTGDNQLISNAAGQTINNMLGVTAAAAYTLNSRDDLNVELSGGKRDGSIINRTLEQNIFGASGDTVDANRLDDTATGTGQASATFTFTHAGPAPGEKLKTDVRMTSTSSSSDRLTNYTPETAEDDDTRVRTTTTGRNLVVSSDYEREIAKGDFTTGFEINQNRSRINNLQYNIDDVTEIESLDSALSNLFIYDQREADAYATYQKTLTDKWTVLGGLRLEATEIGLNQITTGVVARQSYTRLHPSFTIQYQADPKNRFRFSYSHRIHRPAASDLNPFITYSDPRTASSGNPYLKPTETHSFEFGHQYEDIAHRLTLSSKLFFREDKNVEVDHSSFLNEDVLLTSKANGGGGTATGLDFNLNDKITPKLSINLQSVISYNHLPLQMGSLAPQSATQLNGKARFNYQFTPADTMMFMVNAQGKQLTGQGYIAPTTRSMISFAHKFNNNYRITATADDIFNSAAKKTVIDTDLIQSASRSWYGGRTFMIGLVITPFAKDGSSRPDGPRHGDGAPYGGRRGGPDGGGPGSM